MLTWYNATLDRKIENIDVNLPLAPKASIIPPVNAEQYAIMSIEAIDVKCAQYEKVLCGVHLLDQPAFRAVKRMPRQELHRKSNPDDDADLELEVIFLGYNPPPFKREFPSGQNAETIVTPLGL